MREVSDFSPTADQQTANLPSSNLASPDLLELSEELGIDPLELEALLDADFTEETSAFEIPPTPVAIEQESIPKVWYLGLDFGTTGISAVLLNRLTCELYPIYWSQGDASAAVQIDAEKSFRFPTKVYLSTAEGSIAGEDFTSGLMPQGNLVRVAFTSPLEVSQASGAIATGSDLSRPGLLLQNFKPYLKVGIPHFSPETSRWEPVLQWSEEQEVSLSSIHQALRSLMTTLAPDQAVASNPSVPTCAAVGLEQSALQNAMQQLAAVIVGHPAGWSDTYRFNLREAILGAQLVPYPDQIFLVEDVIATLLSGLRSGDGRSLTLPQELSQKPYLHNTDWRGPTIVINAGASVTDLAIVNLPDPLQSLSYADFHLRSLPYAGNAIDQDIICQLIYPAWTQQFRNSSAGAASPSDGSSTENGMPSGASTNGWNWQDNSSTTARALWQELGLDSLPLPLPGEPDPQNRFCLQQRLLSSSTGQGLLEVARHLKFTLQQQDRFVLRLGDEQVAIARQDLGSRVFLPYIQRLNRELNALLTQTGTTALAVSQVVCTGGTASLGAIARWLPEKFPNATIIQDTYSGSRTASPQDNCLPTCSRVAYGLATLPLHPNVINSPRQQYSDYFLLLELLRVFPDQPINVGSIMQLLERRGINTQSCYTQVLALLEGQMPPGLIPPQTDVYLLTQEARENPDYETLLAAPLFYRQNNQTYRLNYDQWNHFRHYLSTIMASTHQKLTEPLSVSLIQV